MSAIQNWGCDVTVIEKKNCSLCCLLFYSKKNNDSESKAKTQSDPWIETHIVVLFSDNKCIKFMYLVILNVFLYLRPE